MLRKWAFIIFAFTLMAHMANAQTIRLAVDLSDAPRNIYHAKLNIPVKPGPLTLVYPKWIPGNPAQRPGSQSHGIEDGSERSGGSLGTR